MLPTRIVAVDLGTYCDNSLVMEALVQIITSRPFSSVKHDYITNDRTDVSRLSEKNVRVQKYSMPSFVVQDKDLHAADPQYSMLLWGLQHPMEAIDSIMLMNQIAQLVERSVRASATHTTTLLVAYPALPVLAYLKTSLFSRLLNVCVLYYAPAFPNADVPWLFDSLIKDDGYRVYRNSKAFNKTSHDGFLSRIAFSARMSTEAFLQLYSRFQHVACWIQGATKPVVPLYGRVVIARPLLPHSSAPLPEALEAIGERFAASVLVTFGSYTTAIEFRKIRRLLFAPEGALMGWAIRNDAVILVHAPSDIKDVTNHERIFVIGGFVPYHTLLTQFRARVKLVVFTGSLCLQNTCLANRCPMMYAPLLVEQFFWAKNYQHFTGLPFADYRDPESFFDELDVDRFLVAPKRYLAKACKSIREGVDLTDIL
jgi:hypothetical protein